MESQQGEEKRSWDGAGDIVAQFRRQKIENNSLTRSIQPVCAMNSDELICKHRMQVSQVLYKRET